MAKILVVEDNTELLTIMEQILGTEHEVATATRGEEAVALASRIRPALAILDYQLPEMDGVEIAKRIKAELGDGVRIIILSAMADLAEDLAMESGVCDVYMSKPATLTEIRRTVTQLLTERPQTA